jgi:hypothetical protein
VGNLPQNEEGEFVRGTIATTAQWTPCVVEINVRG